MGFAYFLGSLVNIYSCDGERKPWFFISFGILVCSLLDQIKNSSIIKDINLFFSMPFNILFSRYLGGQLEKTNVQLDYETLCNVLQVNHIGEELAEPLREKKASDILFLQENGSLNLSSNSKGREANNGDGSCGGDGKFRNWVDFVESSGKSSICRGSTSSNESDSSSCGSISCCVVDRRHKSNDTRWEAIRTYRSQEGALGLKHFRPIMKLGSGDIGTVYLSELRGTKCYFAMKVMDKGSLVGRRKLIRARTEREILQCLDHPFLPTLYSHFETENFLCLVMEFCPGGDLHTLRQMQKEKRFSEQDAMFYVAEVLLALEYLHMLGIIYRDLKPENVLVREDGHIMLSDFDLSLRCEVNPTLVKSTNNSCSHGIEPSFSRPSCVASTTCFSPLFFSSKLRNKKKRKSKSDNGHQARFFPELVAEPSDARSMSFVGTHEYLAPEIIKGEGHGSSVDWWTLGIFLYELLFGRTPFKGLGNRATLFNIIGQHLGFPEYPAVSDSARDFIWRLLAKDPHRRLGFRRGAAEIKQHSFFEGVTWALIRRTPPPNVPKTLVVAATAVRRETATIFNRKCSDDIIEFGFC